MGITHFPSDVYQLTNSTDTIKIRLDGTYLLDIRTCSVSSSDHMAILYLNGSQISQSLANSSDHHYHSFHINEIFSLRTGDRLQLYQTFNQCSTTGDAYNQWTI